MGFRGRRHRGPARPCHAVRQELGKHVRNVKGAAAGHARAMQFDGKHYAELPQPLKFTADDFTVSLWFNSAAANKTNWLFFRGFGYREQRGNVGLKFDPEDGKLDFVAIIANYQFIFGWPPNATHLSSAFAHNRWNHVVVTPRRHVHDVDGRPGPASRSRPPISPTSTTRPRSSSAGACSRAACASYSRAELDDFRIFRRCLSDEEIAALYNHGNGRDGADFRPPAGGTLVDDYRLEEARARQREGGRNFPAGPRRDGPRSPNHGVAEGTMRAFGQGPGNSPGAV